MDGGDAPFGGCAIKSSQRLTKGAQTLYSLFSLVLVARQSGHQHKPRRVFCRTRVVVRQYDAACNQSICRGGFMTRAMPVLTAAALLASAFVLAPSVQGQLTGSLVQSNLQAYMQARTAAYAGMTKFSFGVYSDIHMIENAAYGLTRTQWQDLLRQWRDAGHLFSMVIGDLGYGNATDPSNVLSGPAAVLDAPSVFYSMGNHETDGIGKRAWIDALYPGAVSPSSWTVQSGIAPGNLDHAYYSFNIGPYTHFIVLDGDHVAYDGLNARVWQSFGQQQLAWLAADIAANADKNILVFVHEPIDQQATGSTPEYTLNDKGSVIDLLANHPKQKFVFSGHLHYHNGITRWRGINSVHVMTATAVYGQPTQYGVSVAIDGEQITISRAGAITEFDQHPMNRVATSVTENVIEVAEDGATSGISRNATMSVVGAENGVTPTYGTLMLKGPAMTWYAPRFISEQLIKIRPGMKFSFDMFLVGVVAGDDAVTVQPNWYMKNGQIPPRVMDQNNIQLSQRPRDGKYFLYNDDVPRLNGLATGRWYHREFDLSELAGNYVDGLYLTQGVTKVNVAGVYVDNIRFRWPAAVGSNAAPTATITAPATGATFVAPATIAVSATASDSDGAISEVRFYSGNTLLGSSQTVPYSVALTNVTAGSYVFTAVARDNAGAETISAPVSVTVASPSTSTSATFVGIDQSTMGNWKTAYGFDGYTIANEKTALPPYASVTQRGSAPWTWASTTVDPRALLKTATADRIAATWYGYSAEVDINLVDDQSHRVAMYLLDWDNRARTQTVDVLDATTGALLDRRAASSFSNGQYVVWNIRGRVVIRITSTGGPNAVYSALFFDPVGPASAGGTSAVFVGTDVNTRGNWQNLYGFGGFSIANHQSNFPAYAIVKQSGSTWTWSASTNDIRGLQKVGAADRIASTWYGYAFDVDITVTDGQKHQVSLYVLDWDSNARSETIRVLDAATGATLDTRTIATFNGGQYWSWTVGGQVIFRITHSAGSNAVYSGLFFDR
jgi:Bacterial Ig domain